MERKLVLYIAMSLDGYIARNNGAVDWLSGQGEVVLVYNCGHKKLNKVKYNYKKEMFSYATEKILRGI